MNGGMRFTFPPYALPMPAELRGREITKDIMKQLGAKLEEYSVKKI